MHQKVPQPPHLNTKRCMIVCLTLAFSVVAFVLYRLWTGEICEQRYRSLSRFRKYEQLINRVLYEQEFDRIMISGCHHEDFGKQRLCNDQLKALDKQIKEDRLKMLDYDECDECKQPNGKKRTVYYHTFWQLNDETNAIQIRIMKLNIMSFLATQNLCCSKFIFWKLKEFPNKIENDLRRVFAEYISRDIVELKVFDLEKICQDSKSVLSRSIMCHAGFISRSLAGSNSYLIGLSDLVRFAVLDLYEGIYTDGDVFYLKDMRLLWDHNFAYRWSVDDRYNTAILGINRRGDSSLKEFYQYLIERCYNVKQFIAGFHPYKVSDYFRPSDYKSLRMFSSFLFDPSWLCHEGHAIKFSNRSVCRFEDVRRKAPINATEFRPELFFDGAFAYHLHLAHINNIAQNSWFNLFEDYYASLLKLN